MAAPAQQYGLAPRWQPVSPRSLALRRSAPLAAFGLGLRMLAAGPAPQRHYSDGWQPQPLIPRPANLGPSSYRRSRHFLVQGLLADRGGAPHGVPPGAHFLAACRLGPATPRARAPVP